MSHNEHRYYNKYLDQVEKSKYLLRKYQALILTHQDLKRQYDLQQNYIETLRKGIDVPKRYRPVEVNVDTTHPTIG